MAKRLFARAARRPIVLPPGLADRVESLLAQRCCDAIGLARRAGLAVAGFEKVAEAIRAGKVGLVLSACFPWPWPSSVADVITESHRGKLGGLVPVLGWQPWPFWRPDRLPDWLAPGTWTLGLANGLVGVVLSLVILRGIRFVFSLGRGIEGTTTRDSSY